MRELTYAKQISRHCVRNKIGLMGRFWAAMLVVLGGAFLESARTGL